MLRFLMSGGNFIYSQGGSVPGIWAASAPSPDATSPAGAGNTFAFYSGANPASMRTPNLGGNYAGLIAGFRLYTGSLSNNQGFIAFRDSSANAQCDVRMNGSGQLFFTRGGTVIGGTSTYSLVPNAWCYVEFKAIFSTSGAGTCEVRINGVVVLTATGLTNATTTAAAAVAEFQTTTNSFAKDFYALDTGSGANVSYMGDISVVELFADGAGVHGAWTPNPAASFSITSVANASGGNTVYTGTITGGAGNAYVGYNFAPNGFAHGANNGTFECVASSATSITLNNPSGVADTTGNMPFQCIVGGAGINQTGTRPAGDSTYIADQTTNDISDFAIQPLTLTGVILGVVHQSYMRKDDLGTRQVAQVCLSGGSTEQGATISLGNTYEYFQDVVEVDPNTGTQFTVSGLNASTWGVKEIT